MYNEIDKIYVKIEVLALMGEEELIAFPMKMTTETNKRLLSGNRKTVKLKDLIEEKECLGAECNFIVLYRVD